MPMPSECLHHKFRTSRSPSRPTNTLHRGSLSLVSCRGAHTHRKNKVRRPSLEILCYIGVQQLDLRHLPLPWARQLWSSGWARTHYFIYCKQPEYRCRRNVAHGVLERVRPRERQIHSS
jgi:hypothetical protein